MTVKLTAELIESFSGTFLSPRYDEPVSTPDFHRKCWALYCGEEPLVAIAAPREHAKSTTLTFDYILANVLFRNADYVILIGSTEDLAAEQLSNIREELLENDDLRREFGVADFEQDSKTDIIVRCDDGHRFRVIARGAEQKIRGRLWNGKRPNLLIGDDMEDDEQVESKERRKKFRHWFYRAARQAVSRSGRVRCHGTILHEDSFLNHTMRSKAWKTMIFKAHRSFDDFSEILWPAAWSEERLRKRRQEFIEDPEGGAAGYSQEFLNDPQDNSIAYLRRDDFVAMSEDDYEAEKRICAAADFAVSKADASNRTAFAVGGKCVRNILHYLDFRKDHWNTLEIVEEMFSVQERWSPEVFFVEDGVIWKALAPMVYQQMQERDIWMNIQPMLPIKDKAVRGRSLQRRHRAGGTRWDKRAEWYPDAEYELLRFTGRAQSILDDQFDAAALLSLGFDDLPLLDEEDFMEEEELEILHRNRTRRTQDGRSPTTGY